MKTPKVTTIVLIMIALVLLTAGCTQPAGTSGNASVNILYSKGVGPLPMLLATNQIDGYIAWQPFVAVGAECRIGKVLSELTDLRSVESTEYFRGLRMIKTKPEQDQ